MRVLASAYACEPGVGSESGIGWNWTRQVALRHDVWLVTRENNVAAIEREARVQGLERLRVVGYDLPRWTRWWKRGGFGALPYFYLWQLGLRRVARELDADVDFDVVQHLTFASSWIHSGLAACGKPFVWGPVGQHPRLPDRFVRKGDWRLRSAEPLKACVRGGLRLLDPFLRSTLRSADRILSLSEEFAARVPAPFRDRVQPMLACGVDPAAFRDAGFARRGGLRVLFAGRLVDLKGVRLALEGFARFSPPARGGAHARAGRASLEIVGDGPCRAWLEARIAELGIEDAVQLRGKLTHARTLECMRDADVFLFPSFEGGGMVVPEAMAAGCAVVCLDSGGPGEMVRGGRGLAVSARGSIDETALALGAALRHLDECEAVRSRIAHAAHAWALSETSWDAKGAALDEVYAAVTDAPAARREAAA